MCKFNFKSLFSSILILLRLRSSEIVTGEYCQIPSNYIQNIPIFSSSYKNWAEEISVQNILTTVPKTSDDVVKIANWALENNFKVRPKGFSHNWSPLLLSPKTKPCPRVILVDTSQLNFVKISNKFPSAVTAGAGASLESIFTYLEKYGYAILSHPAPGDISIGGAIVIGGHGTGFNLGNNSLNTNYGTLSNLVLSLKAVIWDKQKRSYVIKKFDRSDPGANYLILNLGRIFITEVTLSVQKLEYLGCESRVDIEISELFAHPPITDRTISSIVQKGSAVEVILFPFTTKPWLKIWSILPQKPHFSKYVKEPYNYYFSDNIPVEGSRLVERMLKKSEWMVAPSFGLTQYRATVTGLYATQSLKLWGASKNLLLYVKPTTLRHTANGYALLTKLPNLQLVLSQFYVFYANLLNSYKKNGKFPINGGLEVRISGTDNGPNSPALSPIKNNEKSYDVAIWIDVLTFPSTPHKNDFYKDVEEFLFTNFDPNLVLVRAEWSKGFAYTSSSGWSNAQFMTKNIPESYGVNDWNAAVRAFNEFDPNNVFSNEFLNDLLQVK